MSDVRATTPVRLAAVADLHYSKATRGRMAPLFEQLAHEADVVLLAGDLTDYGLPEEAQDLTRELVSAVKVPILAVLGNHDFESGHDADVKRVLVDAGVHVLDGESIEIAGVGFAGVKGFAGGFGRGTLGPWGETTTKLFVQEAVNETLKLEAALARLRTPRRVALLHYSPIRSTVEGEPPEIFPYLGCSRLEEPIDRFAVTAVFHGHAHHGAPEGYTAGRAVVFNVSLPLMRRVFPERPFRVFSIEPV